VDMDISMDIHEKPVDMDMDVDEKFPIHGKPANHGLGLVAEKIWTACGKVKIYSISKGGHYVCTPPRTL